MNRKQGNVSVAVLTATLFGLTGLSAAKAADHPLSAFIAKAQESRKSLDGVTDYTADFIKMETVGKKQFSHSMRMKFREKPFSVYLFFTDRHKGRQVLYVEGQNDGKLLAKDTGIAAIVGTIQLKPESKRAMSEGKFPISKIGIKNMVDATIAQWTAELNSPNIAVMTYPNASLKSKNKDLAPMDCIVLESRHTKQTAGVEYGMTRLYIDKKTGYPVRVEQYGFPRSAGGKPPLLAEYTYWNMKTNVGLKDIAFDRRNPRYRF